jgi:UDP-N-acetyl-D-mannosaminuronic acid dehydrogenase
MMDSKPVVAVLGLGRTGLPVALVMANAGYEVLGIDTNQTTIMRLLAGECPFEEDGMLPLLRLTLDSKFRCMLLSSIKCEEWAKVEIIIIHVGFSPEEISQPVESLEVVRTIARLGIQGKTVVLRTTLQVGLTRKISHALEELTGLREGRDFFVAYVPERLWEGRAVQDTASLPHLIGALSPRSNAPEHRLFESLGRGRVIHVSSPEVAEVVKLAENAWRDTTFAFANDLAMLCDNSGIDVFEALAAANTDYPWNNIPLPGPVSGYCLKKDSLILAESEKNGMDRLWVHGRRSNAVLLEVVASRVSKSDATKVLVAGISFKKDIDDFRDSHSLDLLRMFKSMRLELASCDPFLGSNAYTTVPENMEVKAYKSLHEAGSWLKGAAIVLATPHSFFRSNSEFRSLLANKPSLIVDMWGFWREKSEEFKDAGIQYACVGSGDFWKVR